MAICPRCGATSEDNQSFCIMCGASLKNAVYQPAQPAPAPSDDDSRFRPPSGEANTQGAQDTQPSVGQSAGQQASASYSIAFSTVPQPATHVMGVPSSTSETPGEIPASEIAAAEHSTASQRLRNRRDIVIVALLAVLALVAGIGAGYYVASQSDPQRVVESYMTALQEGRFADAAQMDGTATVLDAKKRILLTNGIMPSNNSCLSNYSIVSANSSSGNSRRFTVSYTVGGMNQSYTLELAQNGRKGLITQWRFTRTLLGSIAIADLNGLMKSASIDGIDVTADNALAGANGTTLSLGLSISFAAYPGVYDIDTPDNPPSPYLTMSFDSSVATVYSPANPAQLIAQSTASDALIDAINVQLAAFYDTCISTANTGQEPDETCSIVWWTNRFGKEGYHDEKYTVVSEPELSSNDFTYLSFSDTGALTGTFSTMNATFNHEYYDPDNYHYTSNSFSWLIGNFTADSAGVTIEMTSVMSYFN